MFPVQIRFLYLVHHYYRSDWTRGSNLVYSNPMYYVVYGLFFMLSLLPMRVLYFISDGIYLVVYYGIGYRKKSCDEKPGNSIPGKVKCRAG